MWNHNVIFCLALHCHLRCSAVSSYLDGPPPPVMAQNNGYRCEVHFVTTEDGYILQLYRLPGGKLNTLNCSLPPVILMHGIFSSSAEFLLAGPSQALSYLLADQGYDVWMPNSRGNMYSRQHVTLSPEDNPYWNHSWHEIGIYDLPASIDYVLLTTGHQSVLYVGHSMGTTTFFVMCSERPEYNAKVQYMIALAPEAYITHMTSVGRRALPLKDVIVMVLETFSHGEMLSRDSISVTSYASLCGPGSFKYLCAYLVGLFYGFDPAGTDLDLMQVWYTYNPAGGSMKSLLHFVQIQDSNTFQQFDYGSESENIAVYGSPVPPPYNLTRITVPMAFFCSDHDALANPKDVDHLISELNDVEVFKENTTNFSHVDFCLAKNIKELVYDKLISLLENNQKLSNNTTCVI